MFQSTLYNSTSPHRNNVSPITSFTGRPHIPPISKLIRSSDGVPVTLTEAQLEAVVNTSKLVEVMYNLQSVIKTHVNIERELSRQAREKSNSRTLSEEIMSW